jgi:hypothetical protein
VERPGWDRVAAVAGMLSVVVLVVAQYVAPAPVYPEEQVGGVTATFYVTYEGRLLTEVILLGVASVLFLVFLGGLRAFLARAEGQEPRLAPVVMAAGAVTTGLVLLQAAILTALTALRGNELGVHAQGSVWAARALFYLEGAVGDLALFPLRGVPSRRRDGAAAHRGATALGGLGRGSVWAACWRVGCRLGCRPGHRARRSGGLPVGGGLGRRARLLSWLAAAVRGPSGRWRLGLNRLVVPVASRLIPAPYQQPAV